MTKEIRLGNVIKKETLKETVKTINKSHNNLKSDGPQKTVTCKNKYTLEKLVKGIRNLQGDPHHIATGMAVGVFVAVTPTMPFHTVLALLFASLIKGSKTAAIIGVWFSNPLTIPAFYIGSYKMGFFLLAKEEIFDITHINSISDMLQFGLDVALAMMLGGLVLGIIPSIIAYFITRWIVLLVKRNKTIFLH